jgi:hypothetical protein
MVVASFAFFLYKSKDITNSGTLLTKKPKLSAPKEKNEIENKAFRLKYLYFDTFNYIFFQKL